MHLIKTRLLTFPTQNDRALNLNMFIWDGLKYRVKCFEVPVF